MICGPTAQGHALTYGCGNAEKDKKVTKELEKFTTADFICIAQTVTKEVSSKKDAQVHAKAGVALQHLAL